MSRRENGYNDRYHRQEYGSFDHDARYKIERMRRERGDSGSDPRGSSRDRDIRRKNYRHHDRRERTRSRSRDRARYRSSRSRSPRRGDRDGAPPMPHDAAAEMMHRLQQQQNGSAPAMPTEVPSLPGSDLPLPNESEIAPAPPHPIMRDGVVYFLDNYYEFLNKLLESVNQSFPTQPKEAIYTISNATDLEVTRIQLPGRSRPSPDLLHCDLTIRGYPPSVFFGSGYGREKHEARCSAAKDLMDKCLRIGMIIHPIHNAVSIGTHFDRQTRKVPQFMKSVEAFKMLDRKIKNEMWPWDLLIARALQPVVIDRLKALFEQVSHLAFEQNVKSFQIPLEGAGARGVGPGPIPMDIVGGGHGAGGGMSMHVNPVGGRMPVNPMQMNNYVEPMGGRYEDRERMDNTDIKMKIAQQRAELLKRELEEKERAQAEEQLRAMKREQERIEELQKKVAEETRLREREMALKREMEAELARREREIEERVRKQMEEKMREKEHIARRAEDQARRLIEEEEAKRNRQQPAATVYGGAQYGQGGGYGYHQQPSVGRGGGEEELIKQLVRENEEALQALQRSSNAAALEPIFQSELFKSVAKMGETCKTLDVQQQLKLLRELRDVLANAIHAPPAQMSHMQMQHEMQYGGVPAMGGPAIAGMSGYHTFPQQQHMSHQQSSGRRSPEPKVVQVGSIRLRQLTSDEQMKLRPSAVVVCQDSKTGKWTTAKVVKVNLGESAILQVGAASWKRSLNVLYKEI